jgi:hypothetical protein
MIFNSLLLYSATYFVAALPLNPIVLTRNTLVVDFDACYARTSIRIIMKSSVRSLVASNFNMVPGPEASSLRLPNAIPSPHTSERGR